MTHRPSGPSDFVKGMMLGHAWNRVQIPDLPSLHWGDTSVQNIFTSSKMRTLLAETVWQATEAICMWDLSVEKVVVRETGVLAIPDLTGTEPGYVLPEEVRETLVEIPLPEGVWAQLQELAKL